MIIVLMFLSSEHSVVLSQCSGVALLFDGQQKQDGFTSGPLTLCPLQSANARGQHCFYTAGTSFISSFFHPENLLLFSALFILLRYMLQFSVFLNK